MGPFTMQPKKYDKIDPTNGPGQYDPDRAIDAIRHKSPNTKFSKDKGRPDTVGDPESGGAGPGAYYTAEPFDARAKPMTIPEKREGPPRDTTGPGVAPGGYDPDIGVSSTKPKSVSALIPKG